MGQAGSRALGARNPLGRSDCGLTVMAASSVGAAVVRHFTSRAGYRHLHLQINARVFAAEAWRGLHTVGVREVWRRSTESGTRP